MKTGVAPLAFSSRLVCVALFVIPISEAFATSFRDIPLIRGGVAFLLALLFLCSALVGTPRTLADSTSLRSLIIILGIYSTASHLTVIWNSDLQAVQLFSGLLPLSIVLWVYNAQLTDTEFRVAVRWYVLGAAVATLASLSLSTGFLLAGGGRAWASVSNEVSSNRNTIAPIYLLALAAVLFLNLGLGKYVKLVVSAVLALGVITLFSRSGYIGLTVVLAFGLRGSRRTFITTVCLLSIALLALIMPDSPVADRISYTFSGQGGSGLDDSSDLRFYLWQIALDRFWESPVLGVGLGRPMLPLQDPLSDQILYAHNYYLTQLSQLGILGILLTLGMFGSFARTAWHKKPEVSKFSLAALGIVATISLTGEPLYSSVSYFFYLIAAGVCSEAGSEASSSSDRC